LLIIFIEGLFGVDVVGRKIAIDESPNVTFWCPFAVVDDAPPLESFFQKDLAVAWGSFELITRVGLFFPELPK
jgi:hypothetical protein